MFSSPNPSRGALALITTLVLAGCGAGGTSSGVPAGAVQPPAAPMAVVRAPLSNVRGTTPVVGARSTDAVVSGFTPTLPANTLYVTDYTHGRVLIYNQLGQNQRSVGYFQNYASVDGIATDGAGTMYSADNGPDVLYVTPRGQTAHNKLLQDKNQSGTGVSANAAGDVAVANSCPAVGTGNCLGGSGNIVIYRGGSTKPTQTLSDAGIQGPEFVSWDSAGDIFVSGFSGPYTTSNSPTGNAVAGVFLAGSSTFTLLTTLGSYPCGVQVDANENLVVCTQTNSFAVYAPPYNGAAANTFSVAGSDIISFVFTGDGSKIWAVDYGANKVYEVSYPGVSGSSTLLDTIVVPGTTFFAATYPALVHGGAPTT